MHGFASLVQEVPEGAFTSAGQAGPFPGQFSATSQTPAAVRHTALEAANPSTGHVVDVPVQVSATSQAPAEARHVVPALPAGCVQVTAEPSHWSSEHEFASAVHPVPLAFTASAGHVAPLPVQVSATSHSPAAVRQDVAADAKASAGQVVVAPVHASATSQAPADALQVVPPLPAGCWHATLSPSQASAEQGFPSSVQAVAFALTESAGQEVAAPVHASA